ncbi:MAG: hypothetical protein L6420_05315 [Elusimicrobia bacterium]|nr:hypothetical protein [Elusimicrobiota bacterium]
MKIYKMVNNNQERTWNLSDFSCLTVAFCFSFVIAVSISQVPTDRLIFILLTSIVMVYAMFEIYKLKKNDTEYWLINPAVLASFFSFIIPFGLTNLLYLMPFFDQEIIDFIGFNKAMFVVFIALLSMRMGYKSVSVSIIKNLKQSSFLKGLIRKTYSLNMPFIFFCIMTAFLARMIEIKLSVFGYSGNEESFYKYANYRQFLHIATRLNYLALIGLALNYYSNIKSVNSKTKYMFFLVFIIELLFGFLSGFKSAVVMPIIVLGVCYYLSQQRLPKKLMIFACLFVWVAYSVIEPFRVARYSSIDFNSRSLSSISTTMATAAKNAEVQDFGSFIGAVVSRLNMTKTLSMAIEYKDEGKLSDDSPDFLANLFLAPAHAIIPRFIWPSKPFGNLGKWYSINVWGNSYDTLSGVAMSPQGYLYFAGGLLIVFFGFFTIGIVQRVLYDVFLRWKGGASIVYLSLLDVVVTIPSSFDAIYISIVRLVILSLIAQRFLFKR